MSGPLQALEKGVEIPDAWFAAHPNGIFWIAHPDRNQNSHDVAQFAPRAITIDGDTKDDTTATYATVRGILWGESESEAKTRVLATHISHPRRYRAIFANGTTARGIEINA